MNIVFMGTSLFAAVILEKVIQWAGTHSAVTIAALYCQPDRPAGRGHKLLSPPTKIAAEKYGIPIFQPQNFKEDAQCEMLRSLAPDVLAVASYGLILPQKVLDIPTIAPINVHASLLPRLRGAAPIERAVINGDIMTGVTIMKMEAGMDTGPILAQRAMGIGLDDTGGDLHQQLAEQGSGLLIEVLEAIMAGHAPTPILQDNTLATHAAKLRKEDGFINWDQPVRTVHAHLRGVTPRPGGRTVFHAGESKEIMAKLTPARRGKDFFIPFASPSRPKPGTVLGMHDGCLAVACADAAYLIPEICPAARHSMPAEAFWNGYLRTAQGTFAAPPAAE